MNKKMIIYFSYTENTKSIAEMIQRELNCDILRIETEVPYSDDYDAVVSQGQDEVNAGYKPKLKPINVDLSKYDTVILGTPVWWYTYAPAINTFITENNLSDKTIIPFITNGGWLGHTVEDIKSATGANVINPISIKFNTSDLSTNIKDIKEWINSLK